MGKIKVLIVDDLAHVRERLRNMLELDQRLEVVGEACDVWEAVHLVGGKTTDVIHPFAPGAVVGANSEIVPSPSQVKDSA